MNQELINAQNQLRQLRQNNGSGHNSPQPLAALVKTAAHAPAPASEIPAVTKTGAKVTLNQLDPKYHPKVATAIKAAWAWAERKRAGEKEGTKEDRRISLVLVASKVVKPDGVDDLERTGFGCGKTHIAKAIQWSRYTALDDGTAVAPAGQFYKAPDLMELIGDGNTPQDLIPSPLTDGDGRLLIGYDGRPQNPGTPVVVIDDVGTEGVLKYVGKEQQQLEIQMRYLRVIDYCYNRCISVVITGNMTLDQLAAHIGGRAWSRLLEMAPQGYMIDLTGVKDYRRKVSGR